MNSNQTILVPYDFSPHAEVALTTATDLAGRLGSGLDRVPGLSVAGAHLKEKLRDQQIDCRNYAHQYGVDPVEQRDWTWPF